jgi:uncharacterized protein (DUF427 family)
MPRATRLPPGPGQESVWDYPRPPRLERSERRLRVVAAGRTVADTTAAYRVLETSHPPVYYLPPADIDMSLLVASQTASSFCEFKGRAIYYDLSVPGLSRTVACLRAARPSSRLLRFARGRVLCR